MENKLLKEVNIRRGYISSSYETLLIEPVSVMDITEIYSKLKADTGMKQFEIQNHANLVLGMNKGKKELFLNY